MGFEGIPLIVNDVFIQGSAWFALQICPACRLASRLDWWHVSEAVPCSREKATALPFSGILISANSRCRQSSEFSIKGIVRDVFGCAASERLVDTFKLLLAGKSCSQGGDHGTESPDQMESPSTTHHTRRF